MSLKGKSGIVTGAASGMGEAVVEQLVELGAKAVGVDRNLAGLEALRERCGKEHVGMLAGDIASETTSADAVADCLRLFGTIDFLVNCAGIPPTPGPLEDSSVEEFDRVNAINLKGTFLTMRAVLPHMKRQKSGSIVNISSTAGIRVLPNVDSYTASKWGVVGLSMSAAFEAGPDNVRINTICPGVIRTPMFENSIAAEYGEQTGQATPMRRLGKTSEIADAVIWLLSDKASFVTGATIPVDGGLSLV